MELTKLDDPGASGCFISDVDKDSADVVRNGPQPRSLGISRSKRDPGRSRVP